MAIMRIKDKDGNVQEILVIRGEPGVLTEEDKTKLATEVAGSITPEQIGAATPEQVNAALEGAKSYVDTVTGECVMSGDIDSMVESVIDAQMDYIAESVIAKLPVYNGEVVE
jgi:hypothetical protein